MEQIHITLRNGLGDKLTDLIGFVVLSKHLNYNPNITFNNISRFQWAPIDTNYDLRLFEWEHELNIVDSNQDCSFYIENQDPSATLCPYNVYKYIKSYKPNISFEEISNEFIYYAKKYIKPSSIIQTYIPSNINETYGIHLRKSDKINNNGDPTHENTIDEFNTIIDFLLKDIYFIIVNEINPHFLIVSEDISWKESITKQIVSMSNILNKPITLLSIDYNNSEYANFNAVLDLFLLSKCKEILQGVKYSTFSIVASILGSNKLRNYSKYTNNYKNCLIHLWSSVLEINSQKNMDIFHHSTLSTFPTPICIKKKYLI